MLSWAQNLWEQLMERRGRKRFLSDEEIELWSRVTRSAEPLAPPQPLHLTDTQPSEAKPPVVTAAPNGAEKAAAAKPAPVLSEASPNQRRHMRLSIRASAKRSTRPPLYRRAARSSRVAAARCLRGSAALPCSLPGKWPPARARHHRQGRPPLMIPRPEISGSRQNGAFFAGSCRNGLRNRAFACTS